MSESPIRVVELFAGVGGFRLALEGKPSSKKKGFKIVWANQWEPPGTEGRQFAYRCYLQRFGHEPAEIDAYVNMDLAMALDLAQEGVWEIPEHDLLCGGFPCQDYSVARPLSQADGIEGKKGVLWWEIYRLITMKEPQYILLENVDRMLKSPASQRGRDFAIMLSSLAGLGYSVEWRVINAADYGFPQRRRRVYIYCERLTSKWDLKERINSSGVISEAFPIVTDDEGFSEMVIDKDPYRITQEFGRGLKVSPFETAGAMQGYRVVTKKTIPAYRGKRKTLGSILVDETVVPEEFFINTAELSAWEFLKGSKKIPRKNKHTGHEYIYSEGGMAFPDSPEQPSRTILTGEGGRSASRFKHVVTTPSGRYRRLVPEELEQLQGFPKGWTDVGMSDINRAFCMGNALVVDIPERLGKVIRKRHGQA